MKRNQFLGLLGLSLVSAVLLGYVECSRSEVIVLPPGSTVAGKTIAEWSTNWWRWAVALAPPGDPFTDPTGEYASVNQSGAVFFLAGSPGGSRSRSFTIPSNTYVLMPLLVGEVSQLEIGFDKTEADVTQAAKNQADLIDSLHATFDGTAIDQGTLFTHREVSPAFGFFAVAGNLVNVPAGASGIAVADGYFLMLDPLSAGTHLLNYGAGLSLYGIYIDETDTITAIVPVAPTIITQPVSQTINAFENASFTVTATGYPLNYQWRKDGVDLLGATDATLSLPFAQTNQAGGYTVVVTNFLGSVTSKPPAVLTVNPVAAAPGVVVAWGAGTNNTGSFPDYGQSLVPMAAQNGVTAIAAEWLHTVALRNNGSVVAWGNNDYSQTNVPVAAQSGVTAIAAGAFYTVALKTNGAVVVWGNNDYGQTNVPAAAQSGVTAIAAGNYHTLALRTNGAVVAWGDNAEGQTMVPVAAQSGVTAIAAGGLHSVALKTNGAVVVWGYNNNGQTNVPVAAQSEVSGIAAGGSHTVALKNDGSVVAWGMIYEGSVFVPATVIPGLSGVKAIAAAGFHTMALKNDGSVVAWGSNSYGQTNVPAGLSGVTAIAAGGLHSLALVGTGAMMPVSLTSRPSGNGLILSWSTNAVGFSLESTTNLAPPVIWIDFTNPASVVGAEFAVTNAFSGPAQFYRLRKP
jgi:hypothetical protein